MAHAFPHQYQVHLVQEGHDSILDGGARPRIVGGPPPEFGGRPSHWSPEHLLVASVALCFTATFRNFAARTDLSPRAYSVDAEGTLDKTAEGLRFTSFTLHVHLEVGAGQVELAAGLIQRAKQYCLVSNSLKAPVETLSTISETSAFASPAHAH